MPVKMVASRHHYDKASAKEYKKGETFVVTDDEAERLVRRRKAERAPAPKPVPETPKPVVQTRDMKAETAPAAPVVRPPAAPPVVESTPPLLPSTRARYARRDMQAEDNTDK